MNYQLFAHDITYFYQDSDSKSNPESFSQLLRLLCWCPAYITTLDAVETGVFIWTWLVSAAPQLGSVVLAELVDAWLWTIDTKRGLFASDVRCSGPSAKLRPQLVAGEPQLRPEKDPVEQIMAHRLWLGFFIDRFEVSSELQRCTPNLSYALLKSPLAVANLLLIPNMLF